jgi:hypothetical protein
VFLLLVRRDPSPKKSTHAASESARMQTLTFGNVYAGYRCSPELRPIEGASEDFAELAGRDLGNQWIGLGGKDFPT